MLLSSGRFFDGSAAVVLLNELTLDAAVIPEGSAEDTVVGNVVGATGGSTLSLEDGAGGRFKLVSGQILAGATATDNQASSHNITIRETLAEAANSPRDTVIGITISDPQFANVSLLLGFEGADGSTTITDEGPGARGAATVTGNAQIDTAQFKFGASSGLFDGTGDSLTYPDSTAWEFGSGDFTIEAWVRFNSVTPWSTIASLWRNLSTERCWLFDFPGSANNLLRFGWSSDGATGTENFLQAAFTPITGQWYHLVVERSGTTLRLYADGVMLGSEPMVGSIFAPSETLRIGNVYSSGETNYLNGWVDELRITKGVARYASDGGFTSPAVPFPRL